MNLHQFDQRRRPSWTRLRTLLDTRFDRLSFDEVDELFRLRRSSLLDLVWAREHAAGTGLVLELEQLALRAQAIPRLPRERVPNNYFRDVFPAAWQAIRPERWLMVGLFVAVSIAIGLFGLLDDSVAANILGPDRVQMIRSGELWTTNIEQSPLELSITIFTNNLRVCAYAFGIGVLFGFPSLGILVLNAAMFGCYMAVCYRYGIVDQAFWWIAAHGPLELLLITVSCAAGLHLGRGLLQPGDATFADQFTGFAQTSLQAMGGVLLGIFLLGWVEGTISPRQDLSTLAKTGIGLLICLFFVLWGNLPTRKTT